MMQIQQDISLKNLNTFGIAVSAKYFCAFDKAEDLPELLQFNNAAIQAAQPVILGGGSNVLFTKNVDGLLLKNEIKGIEVTGEDEEHIYIKAGAGESWQNLVLYCLEHNYAGMENLSMIPGNVGASPMQNIGAYGVEIKDIFHSLEAFNIQENCIVNFEKNDCAFGYRESIFKNKFKDRFIITSVTYRLNKIPVFNIDYGAVRAELDAMHISALTIQAVAQAVMNIRSSKLPDPKLIGNAGSFFKNPEINASAFEKLQQLYPAITGYTLANGHIKLAAGWLIEQCGWKGYRKGDAGCHDKQALVLVNYGAASGKEIYALSTAIVQSVQEKFFILLEREVNIL